MGITCALCFVKAGGETALWVLQHCDLIWKDWDKCIHQAYSSVVIEAAAYSRLTSSNLLFLLFYILHDLSLHAKTMEDSSMNHSALAFFLFFEVEISWHTLIPLFLAMISPHQLSILRWLWTSIHAKLHVSLFPWWVPTLCLDSIVNPLQLHRVKDAVTFQPHF